MNEYICLDTSVWIKYLTWEEGSEAAQRLLDDIREHHQTIVLPDFAWAEVASVLRRKVRAGWVTKDEAEIIWESFRQLGMTYIHGDELMETAWRISREEDLPTVYDAAFLAVAELYSGKEEICEFWTADEKLAKMSGGCLRYIRLLE